jgi:hypothetical protein
MLLPTPAEHVYGQVWRPMEQLIGIDDLTGLAHMALQHHGIRVAKDEVYRLHQQDLEDIADDG